MHVMIVAGARPNFVKVAPVAAALRRASHDVTLIHTGQHYDAAMADTFFAQLGLPLPEHHLGVGSASHAVQTARVMERFEPILLSAAPDWVLLPGDVNSTLAAALVAVKLRPEIGCRIVHLEAGLRSHDWRMPEEVNRVLTDRMADVLLTPSHDAFENLCAEGIPPDRAEFVGNVMIDTLLVRLPEARAIDVPGRFGLGRGRFAVATLHRPSNVDGADRLRTCLEALSSIGEEVPVVLPLHPRTRDRIERFGLQTSAGGITLCEPLSYTEMLSLTSNAAVVLTDSGGLQEETTVLGVPCITLREQTERPITVTRGTNALAPWPLSVTGLVTAFRDAIAKGRCGLGERAPEGWDGRAAARVVSALERRLVTG